MFKTCDFDMSPRAQVLLASIELVGCRVKQEVTGDMISCFVWSNQCYFEPPMNFLG